MKGLVSCWSEKEVVDGVPADALVVILRTRGCSWHKQGGCLMCGYHSDSDPGIADADLMEQLGEVLERLGERQVLKLYTSGSFFDDAELSPATRRAMLEALGGRLKRLLVESRPEYITPGKVSEALDFAGSLEVAIGLESANDDVLRSCVNKGMTFEDFRNAASAVRDCGALVRTYIIVKPPFLTEKEALEDAVSTAQKAAEFSDTFSFNPVNVQKGTLVERLWRRGEYRPPWLWSVLEVVGRARALGPRVVCRPSGGGSPRGAHNCPSCDRQALEALDRFSTGGSRGLEAPDCACREQWLDVLELEGAMRTWADAAKMFGGRAFR